MKYLISTTETYRVDSLEEAQKAIEAAKNDPIYNLKKYSSEKKEIKSKSEVIDEFVKLQLVKEFTDLKEPENNYEINYIEANVPKQVLPINEEDE